VKKGEIDCEYLLADNTCQMIVDSEEGSALRQTSCTNKVKNYCCYLCDSRDSCEISCNYLKGADDAFQFKKRIKSEMTKCEKATERLSVLFAEGKITEQSYLTAIGAIESKMAALRKAKQKPRPPASVDKHEDAVIKPTGLWYLAPILFGLVGGIVAFAGTIKRDKEMAVCLLAVGIISTIITIIATKWITTCLM
jgi:hypothetical protein